MKIEKNIPLPNMFNQNPVKRKNTNIAEKMEFGDSVFFKEKKDYLNLEKSFQIFVKKDKKLLMNLIKRKKKNLINFSKKSLLS